MGGSVYRGSIVIWSHVIEFQWLFWWQGWLVKVMSNDCYGCRSKFEWSILCLCMFLGMDELWASTTWKPDVLETQVSESMALHRSKQLVEISQNVTIPFTTTCDL